MIESLDIADVGCLTARRTISLRELVATQLAALDEQARALDQSRGRLGSILSRIDRCYTRAGQTAWPEQIADITEFWSVDYHTKWHEFGARNSAALPINPASDTAFGFVREWFALLEPFSRSTTPELWQKSVAKFANIDEWRTQADLALAVSFGHSSVRLPMPRARLAGKSGRCRHS
jgi:hypothetical protein